MEKEFLRIGILSTAGISVLSIINVIKKIEGFVLQAVGSRDLKTAEKYANKYSIPQAYGSYEEILNLPYIDCVYIPLPNFLHFEWTIKALKSHKNVLCEKPMVTSKREAKSLIKEKRKTGKILMEAMHYRYHPLARKLEEIVRSGDIGKIIEVNSSFCQWIPIWRFQNFLLKGKLKEAILSFPDFIPVDKNSSYKKEKKEGALLDIGCYTVDAVRWIANCDTAKIISAEMQMMKGGVDHTTRANLLFLNGVKASIYVSYKKFFPMEIRVKGTKGSIIFTSPFAPVISISENLNIPVYQMWIKKGISIYPYIIFPTETTYYYQLLAFRDAVFKCENPITSIENSLANIEIIEKIIEKAGF
jgi:predicted dehydrogenase